VDLRAKGKGETRSGGEKVWITYISYILDQWEHLPSYF
jgi:hypothetical protein